MMNKKEVIAFLDYTMSMHQGVQDRKSSEAFDKMERIKEDRNYSNVMRSEAISSALMCAAKHADIIFVLQDIKRTLERELQD